MRDIWGRVHLIAREPSIEIVQSIWSTNALVGKGGQKLAFRLCSARLTEATPVQNRWTQVMVLSTMHRDNQSGCAGD